MPHHFQGKDFLKLADFTPQEVGYIVDTAIELKRKRAVGEVIESPCCVFWDQGENRMYTEKAVLALTTL